MPTATTARYKPVQTDLGAASLLVFLFVSLFFLIDPFYSGFGPFRVTRDIGPVKYVGILAGLCAAYIGFVGLAMRRDKTAHSLWRQCIRTSLPLLVFASIVLLGSLYARFELDIKETFLQLGLGVLGVPIAITLYWVTGNKHYAARRYLQTLTIAFPIVIGFIVWKRLEGGQAFHTELFLFVPLSIYYFLTLKSRFLAWLGLLVTAITTIISFKNTAFLIQIAVLLHLAAIYLPDRIRRVGTVQKLLIIYFSGTAAIIALAAATYLIIERDQYLPSGNVKVRMHTYEAAFERFKESPIVGKMFTDSGQVELEGYQILGSSTIVTHSDLLDIASHGGIVAVLLLAIGYWRTLQKSRSALKLSLTTQERAIVHTLLSIVACGLITALFNSPLVSVLIAVLFWFAVGLLISISQSKRNGVY